MPQDRKEQLMQFLEHRAFEPVLHASAKDYHRESQREKLNHVQRSTRAEEKRCHENYRTASEERSRSRYDVNSTPAKKVDRELKDLGLPRLPDIKDDFSNSATAQE